MVIQDVDPNQRAGRCHHVSKMQGITRVYRKLPSTVSQGSKSKGGAQLILSYQCGCASCTVLVTPQCGFENGSIVKISATLPWQSSAISPRREAKYPNTQKKLLENRGIGDAVAKILSAKSRMWLCSSRGDLVSWFSQESRRCWNGLLHEASSNITPTSSHFVPTSVVSLV